VLNQVFDDPACAIIFELEYVVSIPVQVNVISNKNNKKNVLTDTKKQNEIHQFPKLLCFFTIIAILSQYNAYHTFCLPYRQSSIHSHSGLGGSKMNLKILGKFV